MRNATFDTPSAAPAGCDGPLSRRRALSGVAVLAASGTGAALAQGPPPGSGTGAPPPPPEAVGPLAGRVALVTGAARGIGRATAVALARAGADVAGLDVADPRAAPTLGYPLATPEDLEETGRQVQAAGRRWAAHRTDVRDAGAVRRIVFQTVSDHGRLDILFANAGVLPRVSIEETTDEVWAECIGVNLTGTGNAMRAAVPVMKRQGSGRIVATASEFARHCAAPRRAVYTASKWAVLGLVKGMAMELAATPITVNAVCPGFVRTGMALNEEVYRAASPGDPTPEGLDAAVREQNRARGAQDVGLIPPEDVAAAVLYLVSDAARHVTGAAVDVNGGFSPQITA